LGNPLRPSNPEDDAIFQALVDDIYAQFVELTGARRGLDETSVRAVADGRIVSGRNAQAAGLIDGLGGLETAARRALALARDTGTATTTLSSEAPLLVYPPQDLPPLREFLGVSISRAVREGVSTGVDRGLRRFESRTVEVR
ncbi:MAG: S49 family peptidase, partial [Myxococcota bacterium]